MRVTVALYSAGGSGVVQTRSRPWHRPQRWSTSALATSRPPRAHGLFWRHSRCQVRDDNPGILFRYSRIGQRTHAVYGRQPTSSILASSGDAIQIVTFGTPLSPSSRRRDSYRSRLADIYRRKRDCLHPGSMGKIRTRCDTDENEGQHEDHQPNRQQQGIVAL
jgi:hypothetical protein